MPYSASTVSKLPANVQSLPAASRRQWVAVWNAAYANCRSPKVGGQGSRQVCEATAFRFANGVLKKATKEGRVLSTANLAAMVAALRQMLAVMKAAGYSAEEMIVGGKAQSRDSNGRFGKGGGSSKEATPQAVAGALKDAGFNATAKAVNPGEYKSVIEVKEFSEDLPSFLPEPPYRLPLRRALAAVFAGNGLYRSSIQKEPESRFSAGVDYLLTGKKVARDSHGRFAPGRMATPHRPGGLLRATGTRQAALRLEYAKTWLAANGHKALATRVSRVLAKVSLHERVWRKELAVA